ncbi:MAG TPA: Asp-tRNA(Asn)/Glu-tRNA(Gln) amidotransferase GatCAB subunit C, partial [Firmicutes bacterium]|nr:Asp-tRNA(Asn)/Glu-tRNA(Gln) amidotransferase GatCAB subunit C [Bacillota bacterium]
NSLFKDNKYVKGFKIEGVASETSRKIQDEYNLTAKKFNLKSYIFIKFINNKLEGSVVKFLSEDEQNRIIKLFSLNENDLLVIGVSNILKTLNFGLGAIRSQLAKKYNLIKPNTYDILWVVDFPLFEKSEETGEITPCHHPFTRPLDKDLDKLESEPYKVYSYTYDIVMNGYEAGGGGLRIYDQDVQKRIFNVLGFSDEDIKRKFGWFIDALKFGTPPHGGLAFGLDRLTMILSGTDNIRDVIAFPKNLSAVCPMTNAPQPVDNDQLKDLGIKVIDKEEK